MKQLTSLFAILITTLAANAQTQTPAPAPGQAQTQTMLTTVSLYADRVRPAMVDFDAYENLLKKVKQHRKSHLVTLDKFLELSKQPHVIILDTRSDSMYNAKHIKGAIHLNFSDFTMSNLAKLIPDPKTKILIYCNNNFTDDQQNFATKAFTPRSNSPALTLALNIPTYINLFGYGYRNVYELSQAISINNSKVEFEGTEVDE
jgi:hypothetical protein